MTSISVTTRAGIRCDVDATPGLSIMEILRGAGFDELLAICGGSVSCSTCHVYVVADDLSRLPPIQEDEDDLLETTACRDVGSRLSCQIPFQTVLDGLHVTIAPE